MASKSKGRSNGAINLNSFLIAGAIVFFLYIMFSCEDNVGSSFWPALGRAAAGAVRGGARAAVPAAEARAGLSTWQRFRRWMFGRTANTAEQPILTYQEAHKRVPGRYGPKGPKQDQKLKKGMKDYYDSKKYALSNTERRLTDNENNLFKTIYG